MPHSEPVRYVFEAELFQWDPTKSDTWTFVSLPTEIAAEIAQVSAGLTTGFGSLRVNVRIGDTRWRTSIFPSKAAGTYSLPVKKAVRQVESLEPCRAVMVELELVDF